MSVGGLLAVFAHPDDEVLGPGGTLATYADRGVPTSLVCATRGEAGEIAPGVAATRQTLASVRDRELRDACRILGIGDPLFLGYRDSGMAGTPENRDPRALARAPVRQVAARVERILERTRPRVVVTFGSEGGYGHPDHIAIHKATVAAFDALTRRRALSPAGRGSYAPERLYFVAVPRSALVPLAQEMIARGVRSSSLLARDPSTLGIPDEAITTWIDVDRYVDRKLRARLAHRSQLDPTSFYAVLPAELWRRLYPREAFIRARPAPEPGLRETDLFA